MTTFPLTESLGLKEDRKKKKIKNPRMHDLETAVADAIVRYGYKQVPGYPWYCIKENGEIISVEIHQMRVFTDQKKYQRVGLSKQGFARKCIQLHQLVAATWIGACPPGYEVAHLDGNPSNNHVNNLKYVTRSENHAHKWMHGTAQAGDRHNMRKLFGVDVIEIRKRYKFSSPNKSNVAELAAEYGVTRGTILNVVNRKRWKHIP